MNFQIHVLLVDLIRIYQKLLQRCKYSRLVRTSFNLRLLENDSIVSPFLYSFSSVTSTQFTD